MASNKVSVCKAGQRDVHAKIGTEEASSRTRSASRLFCVGNAAPECSGMSNPYYYLSSATATAVKEEITDQQLTSCPGFGGEIELKRFCERMLEQVQKKTILNTM